MLVGDEFFAIVRLISGEQVMCALQAEDESYIQVLHPMLVRSMPNLQTGKEMITVSPLCAFTEDESYTLDKKNVLFIKRLSEKLIPHYMNTVQDHGTTFTPRESVDDCEETVDVDTLMHIEGNDTKH